MDSTDGIVWLTRLFLAVAGLLALAVIALPLLFIVKPVVTEALRARSAGDWWLPFLADQQGRWGPLAANHWWSVFRAGERGTAGALAWRWGFWAVMAVLMSGIMVYVLTLLVRLLRAGWG